MKPGNPPLQSIRLLDQVRERIRYLHYSLSIEKTYLYWVRFFCPLTWPHDASTRHVRTTMIDTRVRKISAGGPSSPLATMLT